MSVKNFDDFVDLVYSVETKSLLEDFLLGVTTQAERNEFVHRIQIIEKLIKGEHQQAIAEELHVGVATVTRGSKELAAGRFKVLRKKDD